MSRQIEAPEAQACLRHSGTVQPMEQASASFDPNALAVPYYFGDLEYWKLSGICSNARTAEKCTITSSPPDTNEAIALGPKSHFTVPVSIDVSGFLI